MFLSKLDKDSDERYTIGTTVMYCNRDNEFIFGEIIVAEPHLLKAYGRHYKVRWNDHNFCGDDNTYEDNDSLSKDWMCILIDGSEKYKLLAQLSEHGKEYDR